MNDIDVQINFINSNYSDTIEVLDLTEIRQGWMKINYNNKARMDLLENLHPRTTSILTNIKQYSSEAAIPNSDTNVLTNKINIETNNLYKDNNLVSSINDVNINDELDVRLKDGKLRVVVKNK